MDPRIVITKSDLFWTYLSQFLNIGAGIILLPLLVRHLAPADLGLWYVFIALTALIHALEAGMQPTIARQAAYVYGGATQLLEHGTPEYRRGPVDLATLAGLVNASRRMYLYVTVAVALGMGIIGTIYILTLLPQQDTTATLILAWLSYISGPLICFSTGFLNGLLRGRGQVATANKIYAGVRCALLIASALLLSFGGGLPALGIASALSGPVSVFLVRRAFYDPARPDSSFIRHNRPIVSGMLKTLWSGSWRLSLVHVGNLLVSRGNVFVASSLLGLAVASSYALTLQFLLVFSSVAGVLGGVQMPRMTVLQMQNDTGRLKRAFGSVILTAWLVYSGLALSMIFLGAAALAAIGSNTVLLESKWLALLCVVMLLDVTHSLSAGYLTTMNRVPFVRSSIVSGLLIVVLSAVLIRFFHLGLPALVISQGLVQLAYNNWKWPLEAMRTLNCGLRELLQSGWCEIKAIARVKTA